MLSVTSRGNVLSRQTVSRGDVGKGYCRGCFVVTNHYSPPQTDHAFMEPECAVAYRGGDGNSSVFRVAKMFMMIGVKLLVCLAFK